MIIHHDFLELHLDVGKAVKGDVCDIVFEAVFLKIETLACEKHVRMASGRKIGDTVADEDDQGAAAIARSTVAVLGYGDTFVVAEVAFMAPDGLPVRAIRHDLGVIGNNIDARRLGQ